MTSKLIENALSKILLYFPSFGPIVFGWEIKEDPDIPTAGTDYKTLRYNPEFISTLNKAEQKGVLLHEIFHNVFLHPTEITLGQAKGKNQYLWTIALEIVTNAAVLDLISGNSDFALPGEPYSPISDKKPPEGPSYFYDKLGHEKTAEEIYQILEEKYPEVPACLISMAGNSDGNSSQNTSQSPLSGDIIPDGDKSHAQEAIEKAIAVLENLQKELTRKQGTMPSGLARLLKKLTTARVPWQRVLHNFLLTIKAGMDDLSWSRIDTKHSDEILLPGAVSYDMEDIVVAIDTSGSISEKELIAFASEIAKLTVYTDELLVITTDAKVHEKVKVKNAPELLRKLKFKGGGGTDFNEVFQQVKRCSAMVFFTDGYANYPDHSPKYPVLWIVTKEHQKPPFGKVAFMLED